jgi:hypothetical protein
MAVDESLARSLLTDATARYESACRWSLITALVLLVFHVMTVAPFIRAHVERSAVMAEQSTLETVAAELQTNLQAQERAMETVRDALDSMLVAKKSDFEALQRAVVSVRGSLDGVDGGGAVEDPPFVQAVPRLQQDPRVDLFVELIRAEGLNAAVREADTGSELRTILTPLIEREIIAPRFARVEEIWQARLPQLEQGADALGERFAELASENADAALWGRMRSEAERYSSTLRDVVFRAPDDPEWWHTVVGKDAAILQMKDVEVELISPESFRAASASLQGWLDDRDAIVADLNAQLDALQQLFDEQQDRLTNLLVPISGVALDLSIVVGHFPLVLAAFLGVAIAWPERRYRALFRAAALARRANLLTAEDVSLMLPGRNTASSFAYALGGVALSIGWIAFAIRQLASWDGRVGLGLAVMTAGAILIVIAAGVYNLRAVAARAGERQSAV